MDEKEPTIEQVRDFCAQDIQSSLQAHAQWYARALLRRMEAEAGLSATKPWPCPGGCGAMLRLDEAHACSGRAAPVDLAAVRVLIAGVTEGWGSTPWWGASDLAIVGPGEDAALIAAAPTLLTALADEVERLREERDRLRTGPSCEEAVEIGAAAFLAKYGPR